MRAIRIQIPSLNVDYWTSDLVDLIDEVENTDEGTPITITVQSMTVQQFSETIKQNGTNRPDKG